VQNYPSVDGYANEGADRTMQHAGSCGGKNLILATFLDEELLSVFSEEEGGKRENLSCIIFCTKKKSIYTTHYNTWFDLLIPLRSTTLI
jgi:hypothetical protein